MRRIFVSSPKTIPLRMEIGGCLTSQFNLGVYGAGVGFGKLQLL